MIFFYVKNILLIYHCNIINLLLLLIGECIVSRNRILLQVGINCNVLSIFLELFWMSRSRLCGVEWALKEGSKFLSSTVDTELYSRLWVGIPHIFGAVKWEECSEVRMGKSGMSHSQSSEYYFSFSWCFIW